MKLFNDVSVRRNKFTEANSLAFSWLQTILSEHPAFTFDKTAVETTLLLE